MIIRNYSRKFRIINEAISREGNELEGKKVKYRNKDFIILRY